MTAAPRVELRLPAVLKVVVGKDRVEVRGRTLPEALEAAYEALPRLRHHIALESGGLRPHVLCILNGASVPRDEVDTTKLAEGDEIWIHQAISGG
jgi:sulfur carrier protein ThiS